MRNTAIAGVGLWGGAVLSLTLLVSTTPAHAHVHWTRVNTVDSTTLFLSHGDNATTTLLPAEPPLNADLGLTPTSAAAPITTSTDVAGSLFGPHSITLTQPQTLQSTASLTNVSGDLTIEFWFKWLPTMTSSTLEVGLGSGARIRIARDTANPAQDRLGVAGTHGTYLSVPQFPNWNAIGEEEASLNEWRHMGLTIHSTGLVYDGAQGHDVYAPGSIGRIYLNGHLLGVHPAQTIDLAGLPVHDASRVVLRMQGAGMAIDELAIWSKDWSENGSNTNPFGNGRGGASVENALHY